jgi:Tetracyclin repressor-like, C-terminal domain
MSSIHGDKKLQQLFLERFYFPRRKMQRRVVDEAIACGELKPDTDPELLIDALYRPC